MKSSIDVGILGYGAYVPRFRLPSREAARVWSGCGSELPVHELSVPGLDEDVVTMSIEIARNALGRAGVPGSCLGAVWVGSESHPYAVKPTGTLVAEAIGATPLALGADLQFACKAGTEALQAAFALVGSGMASHAMALGVDTAQSAPGDALELTAGAGGAGFVVGRATEGLAVLERSVSIVSDTPDFWRRAGAPYPAHAGRFTGEPGYFHHVVEATQALLGELGTRPADYTHAVFHQPNVKFPTRAGRMLGFQASQLSAGMLVDQIGNTYAGASLLGFTAVLDVARPGDRVLLVSFGSGAGSDAFSFRIGDRIRQRAGLRRGTRDYVAERVELDYALYARYRGKIARG
jgi:hydroxymethylglutaryl-CoA synthase